MWPRLLLAAAVLSCTVSAREKSTSCFTNGTSLCSFVKIPNGETLAKLLQSIMAVNVNRRGLMKISAKKFDAPIPAPEGPLSPNRKLEDDTEAKFKFLKGPESIFKVDNFLYAGTEAGIIRVDLKSGDSKNIFNGNAGCPPKKSCSRPQGIRIKGNRLLCADSFKGLIEVDLKTGESKVLLAVGTPVNGTPVLTPNDLDVDWKNGFVYMSDASTKWSADYLILGTIESEASSRIIRFNLKTGEAKVFAKNIRFANGVQISHDKKSLLVDEFSARQVLKYSLKDTLPASGKPFTSLLPGNPDNIRLSLTGGYWVGLNIGRTNGSRILLDELQARPDLAEKLGNSALTLGGLAASFGTLLSNDELYNLGHEVETGRIVQRASPRIGIILELDANGRILQSLQSTQLAGPTEVLEHEDGLYLGSVGDNFVLSVPRANYRNP